MPRQSLVYEVLIASPSDVARERTILAEVLEDWNSANSRSRGISLQALRWELDGIPASGGTPQEILNKQLVEKADVLIGVFWARLGTPTGRAPSGTAEEIERFRKEGRPVLLYFSEANIPHGHDPDQFRLLSEYRKTLETNTFFRRFRDGEDLRRRATRDLTALMNELITGSPQSSREHWLTDKNELARVNLRSRRKRQIPTTPVTIVEVFGEIESLSPSARIREYSCTLSVPKLCLSWTGATYAAEVKSTEPDYRRFRYTERNHKRVPIYSGDRFQVVSIEIAVGHLALENQSKCLKMEIIADAEVDGEALQTRKTIAELIAV